MSGSLSTKIHEIGEWLGPGALNFFGQPFAGKDTQAENLGVQLDVPVLGGGEILRHSDIPQYVREEMKHGKLIPSEDYQKYVVAGLGNLAVAGKPLLLSSVGRMSGEEPFVILATAEAGHPIMAVPYLSITEDEAYRRLRDMPDRGRNDDTPEALKIRLEEFHNKTGPVLSTYEDQGLLIPINAMAEKDVVFSTLVHALHQRATAV